MELSFRNSVLLTMLMLIVISLLQLASAKIGINYGLNGDNLPPPSEVVQLYKKLRVPYMRLFEPKPEVLEALRGSAIKLALGCDADLAKIASSVEAATGWLNAHIIPYKNDVNFKWITLGNELVPGNASQYIVPSMKNMKTALKNAGMKNVKVSTVVDGGVLTTFYPAPSAAAFKNDTIEVMNDILEFMKRTKNPLFVNAHPYWTFRGADPRHPIDLGYATFATNKPVIDGNLKYYSLFEATIDGFYAAMEKCNAGNVRLVIGESGWPSDGHPPLTTKELAQRYNQNLINFVKHRGTPKRPNVRFDTFIFEMFNENLKTKFKIEKHWGLYYPNMDPVYQLNF